MFATFNSLLKTVCAKVLKCYLNTYRVYSTVELRFMSNCEPPTSAASHAPLIMYLYAQSNAYAELEQAVSTVKDGPHNPKA